jgi:hypothetical protein
MQFPSYYQNYFLLEIIESISACGCRGPELALRLEVNSPQTGHRYTLFFKRHLILTHSNKEWTHCSQYCPLGGRCANRTASIIEMAVHILKLASLHFYKLTWMGHLLYARHRARRFTYVTSFALHNPHTC